MTSRRGRPESSYLPACMHCWSRLIILCVLWTAAQISLAFFSDATYNVSPHYTLHYSLHIFFWSLVYYGASTYFYSINDALGDVYQSAIYVSGLVVLVVVRLALGQHPVNVFASLPSTGVLLLVLSTVFHESRYLVDAKWPLRSWYGLGV